jgi:[ribosomal protein S5]-alanine N-acetyltransferase
MLETHRLVIRPAHQDDGQLIFNLSSDPEVMKYTGDTSFSSIDSAKRFIEDHLKPQFNQFGTGRFLVFKKDGEFIGWCGLRFDPPSREIDLGFRFKKVFWGQGYATESAEACMNYGFRVLELPLILAKTLPQNRASIKVLQKLKMEYKGYSQDSAEPLGLITYAKRRDYLS